MTTQSDPTAVIGRRIVAYIIDTIIIFLVIGGLFFALAENPDDLFAIDQDTAEKLGNVFDDDSENQFRWDLGEQVAGYFSIDLEEGTFDLRFVEGGSFWLLTAVGILLPLGLLVFMQGASGKTPGKALLGITTVAPDGSPPGFGKAFIRWVLLIIDAGFCFLPGLISMLASKGHRRIGDMAAKTFVVRADAAGRPVEIPGVTTAPAYAATAAPPVGAPSADAQWDPARNAWIRWDGAAWHQYDQTTGAWQRIS